MYFDYMHKKYQSYCLVGVYVFFRNICFSKKTYVKNKYLLRCLFFYTFFYNHIYVFYQTGKAHDFCFTRISAFSVWEGVPYSKSTYTCKNYMRKPNKALFIEIYIQSRISPVAVHHICIFN